MNPLTLEWIDKAEGDLSTASRELRARKSPNYDAACFHAQQMAEKYLKACLQENGLPIPYTHSLIDLLALCLKIDPALIFIRPNLVSLDGYSVRYRYPGQSADRSEAMAALKSAQIIRGFIRNKMGL
jgi:HEPN domain-containing protein